MGGEGGGGLRVADEATEELVDFGMFINLVTTGTQHVTTCLCWLLA